MDTLCVMHARRFGEIGLIQCLVDSECCGPCRRGPHCALRAWAACPLFRRRNEEPPKRERLKKKRSCSGMTFGPPQSLIYWIASRRFGGASMQDQLSGAQWFEG